MSQQPAQPNSPKKEDGLKIILTGGAGCIGFAILKSLLTHHPTAIIHILDITSPSFADYPFNLFEQVYKNGQLHFHNADITSPPALGRIFKSVRPTVVIHSASIIPSAAKKKRLSDEELWKVNVDGTRNVIDIAEKTEEVEVLVYTSSCDAVKPDSWMDLVNASEIQTEHLREGEKWDSEYARTKAKAESLILSPTLRIRTCAIRTHGVVGTLDANLFPLIATSPRRISLGSGKNLYDFSSADNVGLAHVLAMNNLLDSPDHKKESANRRAFFVTDGSPKPFRELQEMIWRIVDDEPDKSYGRYTVIPVWLFTAILKIVSLFSKTTAISPSEVGDAVAMRYFDIGEARRVLGYEPEGNKRLKESFREAWEWWRRVQS
ncbi:hydroxysteroid dehydrogenase, putative [Talaromyces stipitatus ATCC 10500]|uniref:Hydroxysteroid dehydrogenase, putative n=1 Tax=Talaromyces stipitatus (strain ATCC 10500 / CBS 375.48 / QM 6759 / NRRL 1006) TaxID=441959 RepID=B8MJY5_TALSN|nr:hydroxysteroid dehydrogenase, putative [Talaromyces stipitatus ATCC 10500]EED14802.1 hydroxysteroid dehydrogenase, putative [Talaromyces stipitatus ATCC 10500]